MEIHQSVHKYRGKDLMIREALEYYKSHKLFRLVGEMKIKNLDSFFTELIKSLNLGKKITHVRVHYVKPGGDHATGHNHGKDTGVFYLQVPKDSGNLVFPKLGVTIVPEVNHFVVVPAEEVHAITENKSDEIRLALAFDID